MESTTSNVDRGRTVDLADDVARVEVTKVLTRCGTRLEIALSETDERIWLDSLELESLTWQEHGSLLDLTETPAPDDYLVNSEDQWTSNGEAIRISNEFADVTLQPVHRDSRDALRIDSPKLGYETVLTPLELAALSTQNAQLFSGFLSTPFGPEGEEGGH